MRLRNRTRPTVRTRVSTAEISSSERVIARSSLVAMPFTLPRGAPAYATRLRHERVEQAVQVGGGVAAETRVDGRGLHDGARGRSDPVEALGRLERRDLPARRVAPRRSPR
jgi:hypothetical protein